MLNDWLKVAVRIAVALERMADAAEASNRMSHLSEWHRVDSPVLAREAGVTNGSQRDG